MPQPLIEAAEVHLWYGPQAVSTGDCTECIVYVSFDLKSKWHQRSSTSMYLQAKSCTTKSWRGYETSNQNLTQVQLDTDDSHWLWYIIYIDLYSQISWPKEIIYVYMIVYVCYVHRIAHYTRILKTNLDYRLFLWFLISFNYDGCLRYTPPGHTLE